MARKDEEKPKRHRNFEELNERVQESQRRRDAREREENAIALDVTGIPDEPVPLPRSPSAIISAIHAKGTTKPITSAEIGNVGEQKLPRTNSEATAAKGAESMNNENETPVAAEREKRKPWRTAEDDVAKGSEKPQSSAITAGKAGGGTDNDSDEYILQPERKSSGGDEYLIKPERNFSNEDTVIARGSDIDTDVEIEPAAEEAPSVKAASPVKAVPRVEAAPRVKAAASVKEAPPKLQPIQEESGPTEDHSDLVSLQGDDFDMILEQELFGKGNPRVRSAGVQSTSPMISQEEVLAGAARMLSRRAASAFEQADVGVDVTIAQASGAQGKPAYKIDVAFAQELPEFFKSAFLAILKHAKVGSPTSSSQGSMSFLIPAGKENLHDFCKRFKSVCLNMENQLPDNQDALGEFHAMALKANKVLSEVFRADKLIVKPVVNGISRDGKLQLGVDFGYLSASGNKLEDAIASGDLTAKEYTNGLRRIVSNPEKGLINGNRKLMQGLEDIVVKKQRALDARNAQAEKERLAMIGELQVRLETVNREIKNLTDERDRITGKLEELTSQQQETPLFEAFKEMDKPPAREYTPPPVKAEPKKRGLWERITGSAVSSAEPDEKEQSNKARLAALQEARNKGPRTLTAADYKKSRQNPEASGIFGGALGR